MNLSIVRQNLARKCSPVYKINFVIVCRIRYFLIKQGQYRAWLWLVFGLTRRRIRRTRWRRPPWWRRCRHRRRAIGRPDHPVEIIALIKIFFCVYKTFFEFWERTHSSSSRLFSISSQGGSFFSNILGWRKGDICAERWLSKYLESLVWCRLLRAFFTFFAFFALRENW